MYNNYNLVTIETVCPFCGKVSEILVNEEDYLRYKDGEGLVQDIFWYLDASERELLMTGICPSCWDSMFGWDDVEGNEPDENDDDYGPEWEDSCDKEEDWPDEDYEIGFNVYMCYDWGC